MIVLRKKSPFFYQPVLVSTSIPLEDFLLFQDTLIAYFHKGDEKAYLKLGAEAAQWGLTEGPYRRYAHERDAAGFSTIVPAIWRSFFNFGECNATCGTREVSITCGGLPLWHPYLEILPMAYFQRGFELVSHGTVNLTRQPGPERATGYTYTFAFEREVFADVSLPKTGA